MVEDVEYNVYLELALTTLSFVARETGQSLEVEVQYNVVR